MTDGALYVGKDGAEGRIVGPAAPSEALAEAINDERLQVAFRPVANMPDQTAYVVSARMMAAVGADFPVLVLPDTVRELWEAEARVRPRVIEVYTGLLPPLAMSPVRTLFGIVRPGDRARGT